MPLIEAVADTLGCRVDGIENCAGGDINEAWKLRLGDGSTAFLKSRPGAPPAEFEAEAAGLDWLAEAGTLPVPKVLAVIDGEQSGLVLEWVESGGRLDPQGESLLAAGLAGIHMTGAGAYGCLPEGSPDKDLMVGPVSLGSITEPEEGQGFGPTYARRLERLLSQAVRFGTVSLEQAATISAFIDRVEEFAGPPEPPARTHGDLWSGNVLVAADGRPWLIDPAAHGAHRELDLAMLSLFGAPSKRFFSVYDERFPLAPGFEERVGLWQIQPLLIHAVLFGGSYGAAAARTAGRYL